MDVSRHCTKHPGAWFALGATAAWLAPPLASFAIDGGATPHHGHLGPRDVFELGVIESVLNGAGQLAIFVAWVASRRGWRRPDVPFVLPLALGVLQVVPFLIAAAPDLSPMTSRVPLEVVFAAGIAGPVLAAEIVTRRARIPDAPMSPEGSDRMGSCE